jgi:hypothetical protein
MENIESRARKQIGLSLPPEAYRKMKMLGDQLGLSDAGMARHLVMMGLQQLMGQIQNITQSQQLARMVDAIADEDLPFAQKTSGGASNTATTGHKCPLPSQKPRVSKVQSVPKEKRS